MAPATEEKEKKTTITFANHANCTTITTTKLQDTTRIWLTTRPINQVDFAWQPGN